MDNARKQTAGKRPLRTTRLAGIQREHHAYFAGWAAIFTWLYTTFMPKAAWTPLGGEQVAPTILLLGVCAGVVLLKDGPWIAARAPWAVALAVLALAGALFAVPDWAATACRLLLGGAAGFVFAACGYGFFMILDNAEKFYAMILGVALPPLLETALAGMPEQQAALGLSAVCLTVLAVCSGFFRRQAQQVPVLARRGVPPKAYALLILVFLVFAVNDVLAPAALAGLSPWGPRPLPEWFLGGIILGIALMGVLQLRFHRSIPGMINGALVLSALGFVLALASRENPAFAAGAALAFGTGYVVAMVNLYDLAGIMSKKFGDLRFYRVGVACSALFYILAIAAAHSLKGQELTLILTGTGLCLLFFLAAPMVLRLLWQGEWMDDTYRKDVTAGSRLGQRLAEQGLTPREARVCELLLQGHTLRQSAAELGIAYSTANTYQTAAYRKLGISSRAELMIRFRDCMDDLSPH